MRLLLSLIICFTVFCSLAAQQSRHHSLVFGVDYLHRSLSGNGDFYDESSPLQFRLGVDLDQPLSTKFSFKTGLRFTNFSYDSGTEAVITIYTIPVAFGGMGLAEDPVYGSTIRTRAEDFFLEVPLLIRYHPSSTKGFYLEGGVAADIYLGTYSRIEVKNPSRGWARVVNMDQIMPVAQVAAGWAWPWREKNEFFLQPTLRYFFTKSKALKMMGGGLEMGVRW